MGRSNRAIVRKGGSGKTRTQFGFHTHEDAPDDLLGGNSIPLTRGVEPRNDSEPKHSGPHPAYVPAAFRLPPPRAETDLVLMDDETVGADSPLTVAQARIRGTAPITPFKASQPRRHVAWRETHVLLGYDEADLDLTADEAFGPDTP